MEGCIGKSRRGRLKGQPEVKRVGSTGGQEVRWGVKVSLWLGWGVRNRSDGAVNI